MSQEWHLNNFEKESKIINIIHTINNDTNIDGILIQFPLPKHININKIIQHIKPSKDVDGLHPYNIGCLLQQTPKLRPCTSRGIITLLRKYKIKINNFNVVIIGTSNIVGKPMLLELLLYNCTVTITHQFTKNLKQHLKTADLIIIAIGKPNFLNGKHIKPGVIIIDIGINKLYNNMIIGDVNFRSCLNKASYITPVPGGVGPMTISSLLQNTLEAYHKKYQYDN